MALASKIPAALQGLPICLPISYTVYVSSPNLHVGMPLGYSPNLFTVLMLNLSEK